MKFKSTPREYTRSRRRRRRKCHFCCCHFWRRQPLPLCLLTAGVYLCKLRGAKLLCVFGSKCALAALAVERKLNSPLSRSWLVAILAGCGSWLLIHRGRILSPLYGTAKQPPNAVRRQGRWYVRAGAGSTVRWPLSVAVHVDVGRPAAAPEPGRHGEPARAHQPPAAGLVRRVPAERDEGLRREPDAGR